MAKKITKTPEEKAVTSTEETQKPTVSNSPINEVIVTAKKWGTYVKGDVIKMDDSTARACIKHGVVKAK